MAGPSSHILAILVLAGATSCAGSGMGETDAGVGAGGDSELVDSATPDSGSADAWHPPDVALTPGIACTMTIDCAHGQVCVSGACFDATSIDPEDVELGPVVFADDAQLMAAGLPTRYDNSQLFEPARQWVNGRQVALIGFEHHSIRVRFGRGEIWDQHHGILVVADGGLEIVPVDRECEDVGIRENGNLLCAWMARDSSADDETIIEYSPQGDEVRRWNIRALVGAEVEAQVGAPTYGFSTLGPPSETADGAIVASFYGGFSGGVFAFTVRLAADGSVRVLALTLHRSSFGMPDWVHVARFAANEEGRDVLLIADSFAPQQPDVPGRYRIRRYNLSDPTLPLLDEWMIEGSPYRLVGRSDVVFSETRPFDWRIFHARENSWSERPDLSLLVEIGPAVFTRQEMPLDVFFCGTLPTTNVRWPLILNCESNGVVRARAMPASLVFDDGIVAEGLAETIWSLTFAFSRSRLTLEGLSRFGERGERFRFWEIALRWRQS